MEVPIINNVNGFKSRNNKIKNDKEEAQCEFSLGFLTTLLNESYNKNDYNYVQKISYKKINIILSENKNKIIFFETLSRRKFEIKIKKIKEIYSDNRIIEIVLDNTFNCLDENGNYLPNFTVDFNDQLLRYWLLKPVIRLIFNTYEEADKILKILTFRKSKEGNQDKKFRDKNINKKILLLSRIKNLSEFSIVFRQHQESFLHKLVKLPDILQFHVFMLISSRVLRYPIDIPDDFLNFLLNESLNKNNLERLIFTFQEICEKNEFFNHNLLIKFQDIYKGNRKSIGNYYTDDRVKIKKIFITPNLIIFKSFSGEDPNRILINYKDNTNNFLRVSFTNDKLDKMSYAFDNYKQIANLHIEKILKTGIFIGNDKYNFFGYSNSQIRSHSIWMLNEEGNFNYDKIYENSGDFTKEKNVSKNAARRGLLFTSAKFFKLIENIEEIPDHIVKLDDEYNYCNRIQKGVLVDKDYNFTDGIGTISLDLAREAAPLFKKEYATAFQIRLGGKKGILSVDPTLENQTIRIRPSMKKFISEQNELYIIRTSGHSPGFLNRQIIVLLEYLGIKKEVFLNLQENQIDKLMRIIQLNYTEDDLACVKSTSFTKKLLIDCIEKKTKRNLTKDPFINGLTMTFFLNALQGIKNKAQIFVPDSGRFIGIIDETGVLEENQIFLRVCKDHGQPDPIYQTEMPNTKVIKGKIVITKNPCLYPGDIQVCEAVDNEKLYHYTNVIVFPKKGMRPIQQIISDGDLDGDVYFACWDHNLIPDVKFGQFPSISYYEEVNKSRSVIPNNKAKENSNIGRENIIDFFCSFLQNDVLGVICNKHLAISDSSSNGPIDAKCIILCCFNSSAVNFGKHGETVSYEQLNTIKNVNGHPDFMEKKKSYFSHKVLGDSYRSIKRFYVDFIEDIKTSKNNFKPSQNLIYTGFEIFISIAKYILCDFYYDELYTNLKKYDLNTEFEFLSGILIKFKNNKFGHDNFEIIKKIKDDGRIFINNYKYYFKLIVFNIYIYLKKESIIQYDLENWINFVLSFNKKDEKLMLDNVNFNVSLHIYDKEYEKTLNEEVEKIQNEELFKNIKKSFFSACVYLSYFNYFNKKDLVLNQEIYSENDLKDYYDENEYSVYDIICNEYDGDEYIDDYDYFGHDNNDNYEISRKKNKNRKIFYSLPWVIDYSYMLENS